MINIVLKHNDLFGFKKLLWWKSVKKNFMIDINRKFVHVYLFKIRNSVLSNNPKAQISIN